MPTLTGTITEVTGSALDPSRLRRAYVRAPGKRASLGAEDRLVSSAPVAVDVTGTISINLELGPALLVIESLDSAPDTYELYVTADMTLLTEAVAEVAAEERPWIESVMVQLRQDAVAAAADAALSEGAAADSATAASGHKDDAETAADHVQTDHAHIHLDVTQADVHASASAASAVVAGTKQGQASTAATTATTKATEAGVSEANALLYRNTASGAATTATTQAGIATTGANTATTKAGEASLDAQTLESRISNAGLEVGYYQGKPYLLDEAVVGVPLTVDNTVGTRVMLGDTMLHGDTGWRNLTLTPEMWTENVDIVFGGTRLRRVGEVCSMTFGFRTKASAVTLPATFFKFPIGFRPYPGYMHSPFYGLGDRQAYVTIEHMIEIRGAILGSGVIVGGRMEWIVRAGEPWPTSLPGTPA